MLVLAWGLAVLPGLGETRHLTYHEALVAQGVREMATTGVWTHPSIGGVPWLEKPPLPWWLAGSLSVISGNVTPVVARLPSAIAGLLLSAGVAMLAARRSGPRVGLLAGGIQATTFWTMLRGGLAEADVILACLVCGSLVALDALRRPHAHDSGGVDRWRWLFFIGLGLSGLVKGIGFGPILIMVVTYLTLTWENNPIIWRRLWFPRGWLLALILALAWPVAMLSKYGQPALSLWTLHIAHRFDGLAGPGPFAGESWGEYLVGIVAQALPWAPLAALGAGRSLARGIHRSGHRFPVRGGDRMLWVWTVVPVVLLSMASARNAHYVVCAQIPWSIWAARALVRVIRWSRPDVPLHHQGQIAWAAILGLACFQGAGQVIVGGQSGHHGAEWDFYRSVGGLARGEPVVFLYDEWDRLPYPSPLGSIPHDLAARLYYLGRAADWRRGVIDLALHGLRRGQPCVVIGRDRDQVNLERLGLVEILARGPTTRWDRSFTAFRVVPGSSRLGQTSALGLTRMMMDFDAGVRLPAAKSSMGTRILASGK